MLNSSANLKIEIDNNPRDFDLAIVSINKYGRLGQLNSSVLTEYGYNLAEVDNINVENGYNLFQLENLKPVLFVVTVGDQETKINLKSNLTNGIDSNLNYLVGKKIWLPLMGTGSGGLDFTTSYEITKNAITPYINEIEFVISVPKHKKGIEFYERHKKQSFKSNNKVESNSVQKFIREINHKLYLVGSTWDNKDQTQRFVNQSIWENGYDNKYLDIVNKVNRGDLLLMKSTFAKKSISILRIKAYGIVEENLNDGQKIKIKWNLVDDFIDIEGLGFYRDTITIPNKSDADIILIEITKNNSDLINIITGLRTTALSSNKNSDEEFDEKFKNHRFVRDVLNKEYNLNLVIELSRVLYGASIKLDLTDDKAKSFAVLLNKDNFSEVSNDSDFKAGKSEDRILINIYSKISRDIVLLTSNDSVEKYFAILDKNFTKQNLNQLNGYIENNLEEVLEFLSIDDISKIGNKYDIYQSDYSKIYEIVDDEKIDKEFINNPNRVEKIPFHLDQVVDEDKLGREPVAKAFVDLIKKDIFTDELNHSFMVHLQGKWGSGKSSFLNFIKKNLNKDEEDWIVVEYNAWQNQHIKPPWWSLIDQVYLKSKEQLSFISKRAGLHLWRKEISRRIWRYSGWDKIIAFIIFLFSVLCLIYFGNDILNIFNSVSDSESSSKSFTSNLGDVLKLILTSVSVIGTLFAFAKFITVPFFINSSKEAKSFVLRASDPMNKIKEHFNKLVDDINSKNKRRQLAIFIDDIDRCDKEFIVQLLEGIQTLFKDKRVLYIVAGDKNWISTSFGNTYLEFATKEVDQKQLGEFFIEKAFQLSFRLPNISEESKQGYWDHILGIKTTEEGEKVKSIDDLEEDEQNEIKSTLENAKSELTDPEFAKQLQDKYNLSGDTASNIVIEEKNKDTDELKHLLGDYHTYIDTNPRSIIRLANNYTMARSILMAERVHFNEHKLFRWLVIEDLCPKVRTIVPSEENTAIFEKAIKETKDFIKQQNCLKLLKGEEEFMEGEIKIGDIKTIKGL